jgi:(E)-4-hydroxy-3-methylbut-2-enyl-diphosphate synthase
MGWGMPDPAYCASRFRAVRRPTREVRVGGVGVGGANPLRLQSMTTSDTEDVAATLDQCIRLAEAGCEIIRITAPNKAAAAALRDIHRRFRGAGFAQPLVADIHFLPVAAMEAVEHVEKVRVNPGNYADKKKFAVREYTDAQYAEELGRLHEAFSPLVLRAKELGRALRIGTNHGSLSDRILNRYGDTPMGMVESALEFVRIAESHGFRDLVLSMKASNPKVMVEAYRLAARRMADEGMAHPLHLGVTEAGEGEDARIKSAIGIGSLLADGLGDTIRVSLTEDPWHEIPVCRELARRAQALWESADPARAAGDVRDAVEPYSFRRRPAAEIPLSPSCKVGATQPPRVIVRATASLDRPADIAREVIDTHAGQREARIEGLLLAYRGPADAPGVAALRDALRGVVQALVLEVPSGFPPCDPLLTGEGLPVIPILQAAELAPETARAWSATGRTWALDALPADIPRLAPALEGGECLVTCTRLAPGLHALGTYRLLAEALRLARLRSPLWIRCAPDHRALAEPGFGGELLEASIQAGGLLVDGLGDALSCEVPAAASKRLTLAYDILQGARARQTKTEFVACPSCGRTLFDIQSTTLRIKARTGHLKGVTIAVMGCIVNGPGEMADADFGYVGGAPGKINLYVGKEPVRLNIPQEEAVERLVDLIREHGKWVDA